MVAAPRRFWYFLRSRSPVQLAVGAVVFIAGTGAAWSLANVLHERRVERIRRDRTQWLDKSFEYAHYDGVKENLTLMLKIAPEDKKSKVVGRLAALESGSAPANDTQMSGSDAATAIRIAPR